MLVNYELCSALKSSVLLSLLRESAEDRPAAARTSCCRVRSFNRHPLQGSEGSNKQGASH